jgi:hypothetical protein
VSYRPTVLKAGCDTIGDFLVSANAAAPGPLKVNLADDLVHGLALDSWFPDTAAVLGANFSCRSVRFA